LLAKEETLQQSALSPDLLNRYPAGMGTPQKTEKSKWNKIVACLCLYNSNKY